MVDIVLFIGLVAFVSTMIYHAIKAMLLPNCPYDQGFEDGFNGVVFDGHRFITESHQKQYEKGYKEGYNNLIG